MKKNGVEALNQHAQPLENKDAFARFTWNIGNPSTNTTKKGDSYYIIIIFWPTSTKPQAWKLS